MAKPPATVTISAQAKGEAIGSREATANSPLLCAARGHPPQKLGDREGQRKYILLDIPILGIYVPVEWERSMTLGLGRLKYVRAIGRTGSLTRTARMLGVG